MTAPQSNLGLPADLQGWLVQNLSLQDVDSLLALDDPVRSWWRPEPARSQIERLIELLVGAGDHLTLLALVQRARCGPGSAGLHRHLEGELGAYLDGLAAHSRTQVFRTSFDAVLAYSHRDQELANPLAELLRDAGLHIFQDTVAIRPGDNI